MLSLLVNLFVLLLILGLAWWVFTKIAAMVGLPPIIVQVAQVVLVIICVIVLINFLLGIAGGGGINWHALR